MPVSRHAMVNWVGDLQSGSGSVSGLTSQAFVQLPFSWSSRTEIANGETSPEELVAAAHASCFAMALAHGLSLNETPPHELQVTATVTFDFVRGNWQIVSNDLIVRGMVPGLDEAGFRHSAEEAKTNCPLSQALKDNVAITVQAILDT